MPSFILACIGMVAEGVMGARVVTMKEILDGHVHWTSSAWTGFT